MLQPPIQHFIFLILTCHQRPGAAYEEIEQYLVEGATFCVF